MKSLMFVLAALLSTTVFAQSRPNQTCSGVNDQGQNISTELFIGKKVNNSTSKAKLIMIADDYVEVSLGKISNGLFLGESKRITFSTKGILVNTNISNKFMELECSSLRK